MVVSPPPKAPPKVPLKVGHAANGSQAVDALPVNRSVRRGVTGVGQKIGIYGPGGIGKSKLWTLVENLGIKPLGIDVEGSCRFLDVDLADPTPSDWESLRAMLQDIPYLQKYGLIAVDSFTKAEEMAVEWTLSNVSWRDKNNNVHWETSIEGYPFGSGYMHVYETFLQLLCDLDAVARAGIHVAFVCHDCTTNVPNPAGMDWIRWEPRLLSPPSGKGSIRSRVREWCDHLLFIGYDTKVGENGKAEGSGTRAIYPAERPTHLAKSRLLADPIIYTDGDPAVWKKLFNKE